MGDQEEENYYGKHGKGWGAAGFGEGGAGLAPEPRCRRNLGRQRGVGCRKLERPR